MNSKTQLIKEIEKEITKINLQIDRKIIKGQPYTQLGRKHAELMKLLKMYA